MPYNLQPTTPVDVPFMRDMLYEAATIAYVLRGMTPPPRDEVLSAHSNARYLDGWGRHGDAGVIAEDAGQPIGAAWYRLFGAHERGDGIVADEGVPEIAIGVAPEHRGRGAGAALLRALIDTAREQGFTKLALSVDRENPARHLYERCGFVGLPAGNPHAGDSLLMELAV